MPIFPWRRRGRDEESVKRKDLRAGSVPLRLTRGQFYGVSLTTVTDTVLRAGLTVNFISEVSPNNDVELLDDPPVDAPPAGGGAPAEPALTWRYAVTIALKVNNSDASSRNLIVRLPLTSAGLNCSSLPSLRE